MCVSDAPAEDEVTTASEFEAAIESLVDDAVRNGVDLRGSWVCGTDDGEWEVMICELE